MSAIKFQEKEKELEKRINEVKAKQRGYKKAMMAGTAKTVGGAIVVTTALATGLALTAGLVATKVIATDSEMSDDEMSDDEITEEVL